MAAVEPFDLTREIKFETFAITRIKGSIIDQLRSLDWVPRSVWPELDTIKDPNAADPAHVLDASEMRERVSDEIARLPEREKLVVALYYYENLTLREKRRGARSDRVARSHSCTRRRSCASRAALGEEALDKAV